MRPLQNAPFCPISALSSNFNPQNTQCIPVVKIFACLELEQNSAFFKSLIISPKIRIIALRNRINSAGTKRMTSHNSLKCNEYTFHQTITRYRLISIIRTGWVKTTRGAQNRRQYILICLDKYQKNSFNDLYSSIFF